MVQKLGAPTMPSPHLLRTIIYLFVVILIIRVEARRADYLYSDFGGV